MEPSTQSPGECENTYRTRSTTHAAVLMAAGLPLRGHNLESGAVYFEVGDPDRAQQVLGSYIAGRLEVNAKTLIDSLDVLRDLVRAAKKAG